MIERTGFLVLNVVAMAVLCWSCVAPPGFDPVTHFPLVGAHGDFMCVDCHGDDLQAPPTSCIDCHLEDRPNDHTSKGFTADCLECHTSVDWSDVDFDHRFPQKHGNARECEDCHTDPDDSSAFQCIECHANEQGLRNEHRGETNGFKFTDQACYNCHPQGRE